MTDEDKAKHRAAFGQLDKLGSLVMSSPPENRLEALYSYTIGLHVILEKIVEDL